MLGGASTRYLRVNLGFRVPCNGGCPQVGLRGDAGRQVHQVTRHGRPRPRFQIWLSWAGNAYQPLSLSPPHPPRSIHTHTTPLSLTIQNVETMRLSPACCSRVGVGAIYGELGGTGATRAHIERSTSLPAAAAPRTWPAARPGPARRLPGTITPPWHRRPVETPRDTPKVSNQETLTLKTLEMASRRLRRAPGQQHALGQRGAF